MPSQEITDKSTSVIMRLAKTYLRPYVGQLLVALFFMIIGAAATASFARLLQPVLDQLLIGVKENPEQLSKVWNLGGSIFLCFFFSGMATYLHTIKMNKISQSIVADIQKDVFSHFMKMEIAFFHAYPSGQLVSRITNDVNVMRGAVSDSLTGIGKSLLTLILLIAVMFFQDWKLAFITLSVFPLVAGIVALIGKRLRKLSHSIQSETANLMETLISIFQGIRQVQAYGMEQCEKDRSSKAVESVKWLNIKAVRIGAISTPVNEIMVGCVLFGIILYGAHQIAAGNQTAGGLMSFIAAFSLAYEPMKKLAKLNNSLQLGVGAADRVLKLLDVPPAIQDKPDAQELKTTSPKIELNNIVFEYDETVDARALNDINLELKAGKVTALVGASGSGKTTILNLIPRFYDVTSGAIKIDGIDIRDLTIKSLRKNIALVSQDITIFDDTVSANIAYGTPDAKQSNIIKAAKMAAADIFISEMPEGYETKLGENGVKLSGGQKQRISIARAMLRDAPILLLDEATSALDSKSEALIQQSLHELEKGRTTLIVAHRLSTIQQADNIVVLEQGRIVEQGTHTALIKKKGVYNQLYTQSNFKT
ncbi:MAG: ATP-binding cassette domain-containing protein [Alphaproteobacteria bacterium]|nr:ATP-binding cassette domain-containing protein [Alphaproteobacteria bacterium]